MFILRKNRKAPYLYAGTLAICITTNIFLLNSIHFNLSFSILTVFIVVMLSFLFFMLDFFILNMITQKVILIDLSYYFKGKVHFPAFFLSLIIGIQEELLFRYYLFQDNDYSALLLLFLGSICFGLIHISFSYYDVFSKAILSLICGVIFLLTNSILLSILFHGIYNYLTLKNKSSKSEVVTVAS